MIDTTISTIWPAELDLGEGPVWHAASGQFYFVDVHGCALHAWSPASDARQSWKMPERIGWIIPRTDGDGWMVGLQSGFARLWLEPAVRLEAVGCPHPGQPHVRLNDAKADCRGHIWAGSMNNDDPSQADGQLTRLDPDGQFSVVERGIHIANGPAIAADGSWMLHTNSWLNTVFKYRLSAQGQVLDKRIWRKFTHEEGTPDGMTMDSTGCIWIAFWGGSCIRQFDEHAQLLHQIDLPATQITSMAFGGDKLDLLIVTSARHGLDAAQLVQTPRAGSVFLLHTGHRGVLPCTFG